MFAMSKRLFSNAFQKVMGYGPAVAPIKKPRRPGVSGAPIRKGKLVQSTRLKGRGRTYTMTTRRKKYPRKGLPTDRGLSFQLVPFKGQRLAYNVFKQFTGTQTENWQYATAFRSATYGRQLVCSGVTAMSALYRTQLATIRDKVAGFAVTGDPRSFKFFIRSARSVYHFTNNGLSPIKIKLFDIITKKQPARTACDDPLEAWKQGIQDDATGASGVPVQDKHLLVGQMPGQSDEFRTYFKVLRERVIDIGPGGWHEHFVKFPINRVLTSTQLDELTTASGSMSIPGWTYHCLAVAYCTRLVNDVTTSTGPPTYDKVYLDVINSTTIKYHYMQQNAPFFNSNTEVATTGTFHSVADVSMAAAAAGGGAQ